MLAGHCRKQWPSCIEVIILICLPPPLTARKLCGGEQLILINKVRQAGRINEMPQSLLPSEMVQICKHNRKYDQEVMSDKF